MLNIVDESMRSENGPEFIAEFVREWLRRVGTKTSCIEPGSPWKTDYIVSFNGKLRDELLNGEIFDTVAEARVITERRQKHHNTVRPHNSLGYHHPHRKHTTYPRSPNECLKKGKNYRIIGIKAGVWSIDEESTTVLKGFDGRAPQGQTLFI